MLTLFSFTSMQYRQPNANQEVSNRKHFCSVSDSLGGLTATSECMASITNCRSIDIKRLIDVEEYSWCCSNNGGWISLRSQTQTISTPVQHRRLCSLQRGYTPERRPHRMSVKVHGAHSQDSSPLLFVKCFLHIHNIVICNYQKLNWRYTYL